MNKILIILFSIFFISLASAGECPLTEYGCGATSMLDFPYVNGGSPDLGYEACTYAKASSFQSIECWPFTGNHNVKYYNFQEDPITADYIPRCSGCNATLENCTMVDYWNFNLGLFTNFYFTKCLEPEFNASLTISPIPNVQQNTSYNLKFSYNRNFAPANDYFRVYLKKGGIIVNVSNTMFEYTKACPTGAGTEQFPCDITLKIPVPCEVGTYEVKVVGATGHQNKSAWNETFLTGRWKGRKPSELSYTNNEFFAIGILNSSTNFALGTPVMVQALDNENLITNKLTKIKIPFSNEDYTWPKKDWPVCKENATFNVYVRLEIPADGKTYTKVLAKVDVSYKFLHPASYEEERKIKSQALDTFNFLLDWPEVKALSEIPINAKIGYFLSSEAFKVWPDYSLNGNNKIQTFYRTKSSDKKLKIVFIPIGANSWKDKAYSDIEGQVKKVAKEQGDFIKATFPLSEDNIKIVIDETPIDLVRNKFDVWQAINSRVKLGDTEKPELYEDADAIIGIAPPDFEKFLQMKVEYGTTLPGSKFAVIKSTSPEYVTAHEIVAHIYKFGETKPSESSPYGNMADDGWNLIKNEIKINTYPKSKTSWDNFYSFLRSIANAKSSDGTVRSLPTWIEKSTYRKLSERFGLNLLDPRIISISGNVNGSDINLAPTYVFETGYEDIVNQGDYSLDILDKDGYVLKSVSFGPYENESTFFFRTGLPAEAEKIQIRYLGGIIKEINKTQNKPEIHFLLSDNSETAEISWTVSDRDNDNTFTSLVYSCAGTEVTPHVLVQESNLSSGRFVLDKLLYYGGNCRFKLISTDNFNTATADSDYFNVDNKKPELEIVSPVNGAVYSSGGDVFLKAYAYDPELGELNNVSWYSNIDGFLGNGRIIERNLSQGDHVITAKVEDVEFNMSVNSSNESKPDISITGLSIYPERPNANFSALVTADIKNIIKDAYYDIYFYDNDISEGNLLFNKTSFIKANQIQKIYFAVKLPAGNHNIIAVVVADDSPGNNVMSKIFTFYNCMPGDANCDGKVAVDDLGILASNYDRTEKAWYEGDFTGNSIVDVNDLGVLASNYDSVSSGSQIPLKATALQQTAIQATPQQTITLQTAKQFCESIKILTKADEKKCKKADWKDDEKSKLNPKDCKVIKQNKNKICADEKKAD